MNQKKPSVKDKILFFWNTEREHDINKTNGHYPHEAEIITITSEDENYYYGDEATVEIAKQNGQGIDNKFCKVDSINNLWIQIDNTDIVKLENKYTIK